MKLERRWRAVSLWQPWASLWLTDSKTIETRGWYTDVRGPVLVHAAKRIERDVEPELEAICNREFGPHWRRELPLGALIGRVSLESCVATSALVERISTRERACGNYEAGRLGWVRARSVVEFVRPIPYRGRQGFFWVPDDVLSSAGVS